MNIEPTTLIQPTIPSSINPSKYIDPNLFLVSLTIGMFITYLLLPTPKVIQMYPNLTNINSNTYKDNRGICYKYEKQNVDCPI